MPSSALTGWQQSCESRIDPIRDHCATLFLSVAQPELADEHLRGYTVLLSAHFQAFIRDMYSACTLAVVSGLPVALQPVFQAQCQAGLSMKNKNPNWDNIVTEFDRFGLDLTAEFEKKPENSRLVTAVNHLMTARNYVAHRNNTLPKGVTFDLENVKRFHNCCGDFAVELDLVMQRHLATVLGREPW
jgi:hypothetical protein